MGKGMTPIPMENNSLGFFFISVHLHYAVDQSCAPLHYFTISDITVILKDDCIDILSAYFGMGWELE